MKKCEHDNCRCKTVQMCVLCKYYDWNFSALKSDSKCTLKNDMVKGYYKCEKFECFRCK